jgi:hypothetical protein
MITLIILTIITYPIVLGMLFTQELTFAAKFFVFLFSPIILLMAIGIIVGLLFNRLLL